MHSAARRIVRVPLRRHQIRLYGQLREERAAEEIGLSVSDAGGPYPFGCRQRDESCSSRVTALIENKGAEMQEPRGSNAAGRPTSPHCPDSRKGLHSIEDIRSSMDRRDWGLDHVVNE